MTIAKTVENYLRQNDVAYSILEHPPTISSKQTAEAVHLAPGQVAKAVVLWDERGYVMAVVPGDRYVDVHKLSKKLGRHLELLDESRIGSVFKDCEAGAIPPIGPAYNMETIIDESLVGQEEIYFVGGDHDRLIGVDGEDFLHLLRQARYGRFSH